MDTSIFIAKTLSVTYLAVGLGMILDQKNYRKFLEDTIKSPGIMYMGGIMALVAGMAITTYHNTWESSWIVIITLVGWVALIKGILLLVVPKLMTDISRSFVKTNNLSIFGVILVVIGIIIGYFAFIL